MSIAEADLYSGAHARQAGVANRRAPSLEEQLGLGGATIRVLPFIRLCGVRIHAVTEDEAIAHVLDELDAGRGGHVVTPNLDHLRRVRQDPSLLNLYCNADLVVADGMPLIWAARLQRTPLPERVAGSSLVNTLTAAAARRGRSIFFLGGSPGTAAAAAEALKQRYPDLVVAGTYCPEIGFEKDPAELSKVMRTLEAARPDIVYVALGSPKQERLILQLRGCAPQAWWLGIGISFSFVAGEIQRAPRWVQRLGMEWLHRLMQEPRRLAKRYLVHGLPFAGSLLMSSAMCGMMRLVSSARASRA